MILAKFYRILEFCNIAATFLMNDYFDLCSTLLCYYSFSDVKANPDNNFSFSSMMSHFFASVLLSELSLKFYSLTSGI